LTPSANFPDAAAARHIALPLTPKQLGVMLQIPVLLITGLIVYTYGTVWGFTSLVQTFRQPIAGIALLVAYPVGILVHEWIHAFGFAVFGDAPMNTISIGMYRFTAYCQCNAPVSAPDFRVAIALPGIVLGVIPVVVAFAFGYGWWILFGALMTSAALGDVLILWALRGVEPQNRIAYRPRLGRYEITVS
jgi:hypothetical protein